jgi:transposase
MNKNEKKIWLGIDVSKSSLDCCLFDGSKYASRKFKSNNLNTAKKIISHFAISSASCSVVVEATGIYHSAAFVAFTKRGFNVSVVNPLRIKSFATMGTLGRTKTDAKDARIIAEYGFQCKPEATGFKEDYQYMVAGLLKLISFNQKQIAMNRNYLEALKHNYFQCASEEQLKVVNDTIKMHKENNKKLEKQIEGLLKKNCKNLYHRYRSIPGVGPTVAASIVCFYGDFSEFSDAKKAAAYAGLCPKISKSGTSVDKKVSISKRGNSTLRRVFYMAALSASKFNQSCRNLYLRMKAAGKPGKVALIAIANKLLRQAMALARKGECFEQNYEENRQLEVKIA